MLRIQSADRSIRYTRAMLVLLLMMVSTLTPSLVKASPLSASQYELNAEEGEYADHECDAHYTVHYGDTLSRIAARYGVDVYTLARANGIYNINRIYPGQYLCIPSYDRHDGHHEEYGDDDHRNYDDHNHSRHEGNGYDHHGAHGYGYHDDDGYSHPDHSYGYSHPDDHGYSDYEYGNNGYYQQTSGYYQTNGGHTGVCYYPDPRYEPEDAQYYEEDERPSC